MEDFFKQFKENLENRPEPEFDGRVWRGIKHSLDREDGKRRPVAFAWWWAALPLLLLLIGSNAWTLLELRATKAEFQTLALQADTVYLKQIVYLTDTVYRTEVVRETVYRDAPPAGFFASGKMDLKNQDQPRPAQVLPGGNEASTSIFKNEKTAADAANISPQPAEDEPFMAIPGPIPTLGIQPLTYPAETPKWAGLDQTPVEEKTTFREVWQKAKEQARHVVPNTFRLGPNAAGCYPMGEEINPMAGYSAGLSLQAETRSELRVLAEFQYGKYAYEANRMGEDIGVPVVDLGDSFEFVQADVPQPYTQFSILLQYPFFKKLNTRPFVGIGLGRLTLRTYDISYEFENQLSGVIFQYDLEEVTTHQTFDNLWFGQLGVERKLGRHFLGQMAVTYRGSLQQTTNPLPRALGLQGSILYEF